MWAMMTHYASITLRGYTVALPLPRLLYTKVCVAITAKVKSVRAMLLYN